MRKLLLASAAIVGASGGLAIAQPVSPNQGQVVAPYGAGPTYNNISNSWGNASLSHGSAAAGGLSSYAYIGQGLYALPTPGTVVIRLGGKVEADFAVESTSLDRVTVNLTTPPSIGATGTVTPASTHPITYKVNPVYIGSYARLYPGFDGLSANGIRYGAQIEIRENFQNALSASGTNAAPAFASPSVNSSAETLFIRRAYTYVASDQVGIIRLGQGDGVIGLFDPCIFSSQCWDAGVGVYQSALFGTFGPANAGGGGANNYPWLAQAGAEYANNKVVYLSPQYFGFDIGVQYAPSQGNAYQNSSPNVGIGAGGTGVSSLAAPSTAVPSDAYTNVTTGGSTNRWYNQAGVGIRFDKAFGPIDVKAFGFYEHAAGENNSNNEASGLNAVAFTGANNRGLSANRMIYDPLSFYMAGLAVTTMGLTLAADYVGGRVDNQLSLVTKGGAPTSATVVGLNYINGPLTLGTAVGFIDSQGSTNLTGISQRHQFEVALGGNYRLAPGINLVFEYAYYQTHQGGFNFLTNSANNSAATGPLSNGAYNDTKTNGLLLTTMLTW